MFHGAWGPLRTFDGVIHELLTQGERDCTSSSLIHSQVIVQPMFRSEVLSLYRRIFRLARQWQATTAVDTEAERQYIRDEARKLFHKNKEVSLYFSLNLL